MSYDLYPAVDGATYQFPPEVRAALAVSLELRNTVVPMTTTLRNNLTAGEKWDGRVILNTTTDHLERYDLGSTSWLEIANAADILTSTSQAMPTGAIITYGGTTAPTGWHLCDGTAHGSSALQAVIGSANTPDLRNRFIVGAGSTYANKAVGGAATVSLTEANLPIHTHANTLTGTTSFASNDHKHQHVSPITLRAGLITVTPPSDSILDWGSSTVDYNDAPVSSGHELTSGSGAVRERHIVTSSTNSASASVGLSNASVGSGTPHENLPPYYALTYIIKKI